MRNLYKIIKYIPANIGGYFMEPASQYQRILLAIIVGIVLGIILSLVFVQWLWLPLMVGVCFIFSLFCKSASELPEEKQK